MSPRRRVALIRVAIRVPAPPAVAPATGWALGHSSALSGARPPPLVPTHRRTAKHRRPQHRRSGGQRRPGPARLTVAVAAVTTVAGAASAGVALAAAPADSTAGAQHQHLVAAGRARPDVGQATGGTTGRATDQGAARQADRRDALKRTAKATSRRQASPSPSPRSSTSAAAGSAPTKPFLVYDSVVPGALPTGHMVAVYATGGRPAQPSELTGRGPVLWIDVEGTDPGANVLDVEPGCASPSVVPGWITQRLTAHPGALAIIYTTIDEWALVRSEIAALPAGMRAQVRWWIADPTGYPHVVAGSDATQWYWGSSYDISTATPRF